MIETFIKCNISSLKTANTSANQEKFKFSVPKEGLFQLPAPHWTSVNSNPSETDPMFINGYWARQQTRYKVLPNMYEQLRSLLPKCEWMMFNYEVKPYKVHNPFNIYTRRLTYGLLATDCTKEYLRIVVVATV